MQYICIYNFSKHFSKLIMRNILLIISFFISYTLSAQTLKATNELALVTVHITNYKGVASVGDLVKFKSKKTGKVYTGTSSDDGTFQILLPKETFIVLVQGFEMEDTNNELPIPDIEGEINFAYTIQYELPKVFVLQNVHFDTGKSTIRTESYSTLNDLAELMKRKKRMVIELAGHTDNVGNDLSNMILSQERAESVKSYLLKKGVASQRIVAKGYGTTRPVATNSTAEGRQKNRRTEVNILNE